jgi:glycosyltransferase involved in cell wall biosynthesis
VAAHVTVGERSARELERVTGLPPGSVRTIRNGVPDVPLEPLPRPRAGPIIGSLGRLEPTKGFDVLLRALPAIPEATLVLVGEGSDRGALEELADALGVGERVVFAGWSEDARRQLTTFDVFALPSRFEASPLSVLEAMLASLPVVASDVGSVGEAVENGRTGILVAPEDPEALGRALRGLLDDPDRAQALGHRGREQALERFSVDGMVQAYERLYEEVAR